jgi:hypothetical protein
VCIFCLVWQIENYVDILYGVSKKKKKKKKKGISDELCEKSLLVTSCVAVRQ